MKYRVWYVKYVSFVVESNNEDEAIDLADKEYEEYERLTNDNYYEFDEVEKIDE